MAGKNTGRKLGRGLGALLPKAAKQAVEEVVEESREFPSHTGESGNGHALLVDIDLIDANRDQPRETFAPEHLKSLSESISSQGILQPLIVCTKGDRYELVAGERRLRASKLAGMSQVPVVIQDIAESRMLELALVENLQREDLNAIEIAHAYQRLADKFSFTHEEIGKRVGVSREQVSNTLRLLSLPKEVQEIVLRGTVRMGHAKILLSLEQPGQVIALARRIDDEGLTVRETEHLVKEMLVRGKSAGKKIGKAEKKSASKNAVISELEEKLRQVFGTKVNVNDAGGKGSISIDYYSHDDLQRILDILSIDIM